MAQFTLEQLAEIERRIAVQVGVQSTQFGSILQDGRAQVEEARSLLSTHVQSIASHEQELHNNADRVSGLVEQLNAKEAQLSQLNAGVTAFAAQQAALAVTAAEKASQQDAQAAEQAAGLERLTRQTEDALTKLDQSLHGFDAKLASAVENCKTGAIAEIEVLRGQMYTYSVGAKAEITEIVAAISSGQGAGFKGGFGKGFGGDTGKGSDSGFGKGVDRKELAVWKLPDDVTKIQWRHWANAVDLQLEAVHNWRHADIVLNRIEVRGPDRR
jgi:hypothetical protein